MKIVKKKRLGIISLLLACMLVFMTGCQNSDGAVKTQDGSAQEGAGEDADSSKNAAAAENGTGRYLETDVELPEEISAVRAMEKLDDGRIALFDGICGLYLSEDNGQTFTYQKLAAMEELMQEEKYVPHAAIAGDGSVVLEYYDGMDGDEVKYRYVYIDRDGNGSEFTWEAPEYCTQYLFLEDGRLLGCGDGVYVIDPQNGGSEKLCDSLHTVEYMRQIGDLLYLVEAEGLEIYDLAAGEFETDEVLEDFVRDVMEENAGSFTEGAYPVLMYKGDSEDSLYIATYKGLFRHVLKGNVMEEVIGGDLSSMGSAVTVLSAMVFLDKENLLICYNSSLLKSYHYDPDISAVPENELVVYSLEENDAVRTAINLYQKENPDTFLTYEVGMSGDDGITKEDAIRNLNTELLSGEGPDILVLDGLPWESYAEKGILADLSEPINEGCEAGEFYEKIVTTYENEQGICAVPVYFGFTICAGKGAEGVADLESLADRVEELRIEYPQGSITGSYREKEVLLRLYDICSPAMIKEDGSLDEEKLREYLTQAKRIWQAEAADPDTETAQNRVRIDDAYGKLIGASEWFNYVSQHALDYGSGAERLLFGELTGVDFNYSEVTSVMKVLNEELNVSVLSGLSQNVFIPHTVMGVNAAGTNRETAEDFVMSMIGAEMQKQPLGMGFPVNREAMEEELQRRSGDGEEAGYVSWMDEDGNMGELEITWPTEEQLKELEAMIESLDTPASTDENVREAVAESGVSALNGEKSVDEAVNEIINKVQIYLAE